MGAGSFQGNGGLPGVIAAGVEPEACDHDRLEEKDQHCRIFAGKFEWEEFIHGESWLVGGDWELGAGRIQAHIFL
jgi:hypothetical protein